MSETDKILTALQNVGINCAEITFRTACAAEAIKYAREKYPTMSVGAGTIINAEQCKTALEAGAQFIVSPGLSVAVAEICKEKNIPYYPGCVTPTEIIQAIDIGLTTLKFFPAGVFGGLKAIKALGAAFPAIKFMPTGGIGPKNLAEYLNCKAIFACGGSWMVPGDMITEGKFDEIEKLTAEAAKLLKEIRA